MTTTESVIFYVGGSKYQVSRSLLSKHPVTMLARSTSNQWQKDPESQIFIDHDGERFRYCLDWTICHDGQVRLPSMISKKVVIDDLRYRM